LLLIVINAVIGFIGSLISINSAIGLIGIIASICAAIVIFIVGYFFYIIPCSEEITPSDVKISTKGNHSPGIVMGDYKVKINDRPRNRD
jgi:hypothetical protein